MNGVEFAGLVFVAVLAFIFVPYCMMRAREQPPRRRAVARGWKGWRWDEPTWDEVWRR